MHSFHQTQATNKGFAGSTGSAQRGLSRASPSSASLEDKPGRSAICLASEFTLILFPFLLNSRSSGCSGYFDSQQPQTAFEEARRVTSCCAFLHSPLEKLHTLPALLSFPAATVGESELALPCLPGAVGFTDVVSGACLLADKRCVIHYPITISPLSTTHTQIYPIQTDPTLVDEGLSSLPVSPDAVVDILSLMEAVPSFSAKHAIFSSAAGCSLNDPALLSLREAGRVAMPVSTYTSSSFFSCAFLFRRLDDQPLAAVLSGIRLSPSFSCPPAWQGRLELRTSLPAAWMPSGKAASFLAFLSHGLFRTQADAYEASGVAGGVLFSPPAMAGKLQSLLRAK